MIELADGAAPMSSTLALLRRRALETILVGGT
jgi:hypothetical protein